MKTKCHHLTSLIRLWAWCRMVFWGRFPLFESRIQREENASQQRNRNEFWQRLTNHWKSGLIRMPTLVRRTDRIYLWGMEKKVSFLIFKVLQIAEDGQWVEGRMGAMFLSRSMVPVYSGSSQRLSHQRFWRIPSGNKCPKRNDIYLVEWCYWG